MSLSIVGAIRTGADVVTNNKPLSPLQLAPIVLRRHQPASTTSSGNNDDDDDDGSLVDADNKESREPFCKHLLVALRCRCARLRRYISVG